MNNEFKAILESDFKRVSYQEFDDIIKENERLKLSLVGGGSLLDINVYMFKNFKNDMANFNRLYGYTNGKKYILYYDLNNTGVKNECQY